MNREEAADILKRFNEWRRDNDSDFPELPDSPPLIGEAIGFSVAELSKTCKNCRHCDDTDGLLRCTILKQIVLDDFFCKMHDNIAG